ncbi:hypothetical protein HU200_011032 [Digitaria exilis]|uniref:Uncharacterized protein n=1 Tax=Digitaria exilis TaxID=1010633 RepID=A0A835FHC2_9POAL|nr:hypothetical protein HU200_011032 [Digitaria exilis]
MKEHNHALRLMVERMPRDPTDVALTVCCGDGATHNSGTLFSCSATSVLCPDPSTHISRYGLGMQKGCRADQQRDAGKKTITDASRKKRTKRVVVPLVDTPQKRDYRPSPEQTNFCKAACRRRGEAVSPATRPWCMSSTPARSEVGGVKRRLHGRPPFSLFHLVAIIPFTSVAGKPQLRHCHLNLSIQFLSTKIFAYIPSFFSTSVLDAARSLAIVVNLTWYACRSGTPLAIVALRCHGWRSCTAQLGFPLAEMVLAGARRGLVFRTFVAVCAACVLAMAGAPSARLARVCASLLRCSSPCGCSPSRRRALPLSSPWVGVPPPRQLVLLPRGHAIGFTEVWETSAGEFAVGLPTGSSVHAGTPGEKK